MFRVPTLSSRGDVVLANNPLRRSQEFRCLYIEKP